MWLGDVYADQNQAPLGSGGPDYFYHKRLRDDCAICLYSRKGMAVDGKSQLRESTSRDDSESVDFAGLDGN